jgi:class 3 adenylate cyclase/tetratricopeptide (TPR) repeat protein
MNVLNWISGEPQDSGESKQSKGRTQPTASHQRTMPLALVFTDMVGSSAAKRAEALGPDASARDHAYLEGIQAKHLHLVRTAIAEHNGQEVMTIGDSFFLTFGDVVDAVRCAAAIQQRLRAFPIDTPSGPLRLRIGIHIGTPEYFENSWHGTDVDIAARAESAGTPQQIVLTDAACAAAGPMTGIQFRPLGTFTLKGVGEVKLWDADYDQHGPRAASIASNQTRHKRKLVAFGVIGLVLLAGLGFAGRYLWQQHKLQQQVASGASSLAKDSIILADFENKTGEPVFDTTLTQAFTIQLEQSPVLNLVSQQHIRQSMQYLGKSQDDPITPAIAREIGEREGIKAYLTGSIAKLGNTYVITVTAQNARTGDDIASEQAQAADKEHVIEAIGTVATAMRARLGESLSSIQKLDTPFGQATTPSLEAFRAFAMGDVEHEKGLDMPQAEGHYRQAIELDPNFALAWARLGVVYNNSGEPGRGLRAHTKAFELSKNVSERERLYIQGHYYMNATGNLEKAIDTLELAVKTYPLDVASPLNLGVAQTSMGRLEEGLASNRKAMAIDPDDAIARANDLVVLIQLDRMSEAKESLAEMVRLHLDDSTNALATEYNYYYLTGDKAAMAQVPQRIAGREDEFRFKINVALGDEFSGRYRAAEKTWNQTAEEAALQKAPDGQASALLNMVTGRALAGNCQNAAQTVKQALALDRSKPTLVSAVLAAALCNNRTDALPLMTKLSQEYPEDTIIQRVMLPESRAALALAAHQPQAALHQLEGSKAYYLVGIEAYLEGLAYLDLHDGSSAIETFQRATKYKGNALAGLQDYGQSLLGLARAYTMTGDKNSAKKTYAQLLDLWKEADADLPQLLAAKKEYAALQ